jgi:septum formation protein
MSDPLKKYLNGNLVLASESPRRAQLLSLIGLKFEIHPSRINEDLIEETDPVWHVLVLSLAKAQEVARRFENVLVIGADTIVVLDGHIMGKPATGDEAREMLHRLSGRTHQVYTGFALVEKPGKRTISDYEVTSVRFRTLHDWEIESYVETKNPMDKAGAYGIQDQSAVFADRIEGCFYNVVGFPLTKFYTTLLTFIEPPTNNSGAK